MSARYGSDPTPESPDPGSTMFLNIVAYMPIALYAESLRVTNALIHAICSRTCVHPPITGCVKDLSLLWNISQRDIFDYPSASRRTKQVVSLRHGNTFTLANSAFLDSAEITDRGSPDIPLPIKPGDDSLPPRPTILSVTFLTPKLPRGDLPSYRARLLGFWLPYVLTFVELAALVAISVYLAVLGIYIGAILLQCLVLSTLLIMALQRLSRPIIANQLSIHNDISKTVANGAAVDVHVIASDWNASKLDVVIGYSAQLHALTNIPIYSNNSIILKWISRALVCILIAQAALLTSLTGGGGGDNSSNGGSSGQNGPNQQWGSLAWFLSYLAMTIYPFIWKKLMGNPLLESQPVVVERLPPMMFTGRRRALAFIATLPASIPPHVGKWDWLDVFIPPNSRRREWEAQMDVFLARMDATNTNDPRAQCQNSSSESTWDQVERFRKDKTFAEALKKYLQVTKWKAKNGSLDTTGSDTNLVDPRASAASVSERG